MDEDHQEVIVDQPAAGEFFGFASMLEQTPHQTNAVATEDTVAIEVDRNDILILLQRKPHAGMDMLTVLGRQFHASQQLVRLRASRNPNELIEEKTTFGERIADAVAGFGGSWTFIIMFAAAIIIYSGINIFLRNRAWDPYPFILLNLFLSMLAAIQAPVIMMSQNRQDTKDRLRGELDFDVNRRAESEIQGLARKMNLLGDKLGDLEDLIRYQATQIRQWRRQFSSSFAAHLSCGLRFATDLPRLLDVATQRNRILQGESTTADTPKEALPSPSGIAAEFC